MIGWVDIYKVVEAMLPLYAALALGYGSVRWWHIFTREQTEAVNRLVSYFALPFFTFEFTIHVDPYTMNYRFIAADAISKIIIVLILAAWVRFSSKGSYCWSITSYSLSTLTNSLVVGVPLLRAMYGPEAVNLVVQLSVVQAIIWLTLLLFLMELHKTAGADIPAIADSPAASECNVVVVVPSSDGKVEAQEKVGSDDSTSLGQASAGKRSFLLLMKTVWLKLAANPNTYACYLGIAWAFIASRWHFGMPNILEGCVLIMSKSGTGMAMFSMGLFMALQEKVIACGPKLTIFGMALRFIGGPATMVIGSIIVGLRGELLRIAIIQAALPQSITSFIFARDYGLHAEVLSTAVIFGMLVSLPVLVAYYVVLEAMH